MNLNVKDRSALNDAVAQFLAKGGTVTVSTTKTRETKISKETKAIVKAYNSRYDEKNKA